MAANIPMITMVTINSINVKPKLFKLKESDDLTLRLNLTTLSNMVGSIDDGTENCQNKHESRCDSGQCINFFDRMFAHQYICGHGDDKAECDHSNNGECFVIHDENVDIYLLFGNLVDS